MLIEYEHVYITACLGLFKLKDMQFRAVIMDYFCHGNLILLQIEMKKENLIIPEEEEPIPEHIQEPQSVPKSMSYY